MLRRLVSCTLKVLGTFARIMTFFFSIYVNKLFLNKQFCTFLSFRRIVTIE